MIYGINHIGIGVENTDLSKKELAKYLGFKIQISHMEYDIWELEAMFSRKPRMSISNLLCPYDGSVIELFRHIDTKPRKRWHNPKWGDIGIIELGILVENLEGIRAQIKRSNVSILSNIESYKDVDGNILQYMYIRNRDGVLIQLLDSKNSKAKSKICGIAHVGIGVRDIKCMQEFYGEVLGFNKVDAIVTCIEEQMSTVMQVDGKMQWIYLSRGIQVNTPLGTSMNCGIKLIHCVCKEHNVISDEVRFGDIGLCEIGIESDNVDSIIDTLRKERVDVVVEPTCFNQGLGPKGKLAYIKDPEGNVIELVQADRLFMMSPKVLKNLVVKPLHFMARKAWL